MLSFGTLAAILTAGWNAYGLYSPGLLILPVPVLVGLVLGGRDLPSKCSPLMADREKLRRIIVNLVVNAFKFTREGSVTVRLVCQSAGVPVLLEVEDTGIGIPTEKLDEIFKRFVQVDSGTSRKSDGTGLGLSICKDLCDLMGFRLSVESKPGKGTTFRVNFS